METYDINGCFEKVNTKIKLSINREITNSDSFISILKMAYEFAASNINGYVDDEKAIAIADVLKKASYSDALKYVSMRENSWGGECLINYSLTVILLLSIVLMESWVHWYLCTI
ncbi:hypothetical protein O5699_25835 [Escherichia coli]|nr:hypothetical protein [Escherichia coli]